eukprot:g1272.t1
MLARPAEHHPPTSHAHDFRVGETVRVRVSPEEQRRGTISFLEEAEGTVDLLLLEPLGDGSDELNDVKISSSGVKRLLLCECELAAMRDQKAAREYYSVAIDGMKATDGDGAGADFLLCSYGTSRGGQHSSSKLILTSRRNHTGGTLGIPVHDRTITGALYLNRARCLDKLGLFAEAAQDLTVVLGLYEDLVAAEAGGDGGDAASAHLDLLSSSTPALEPSIPREAALEKASKAYFLRAKTKQGRKKFDAAQRDVESGQQLILRKGANDLDFRKLAREIEVAKRSFVAGNKSIAREIAKWADKALDEQELS